MTCACGQRRSYLDRARAAARVRGMEAVPADIAALAEQLDAEHFPSARDSAVHEAGHAIFCRELGGELASVGLDAAGGVTSGKWPQGGREFCLTLLAGRAAVAYSQGRALEVPPDELERSLDAALSAGEITCDICRVFRALDREDPHAMRSELISRFKTLAREADVMVSRADTWTNITRVADELQKRRFLNATQVEEAVRTRSAAKRRVSVLRFTEPLHQRTDGYIRPSTRNGDQI